jgi:hypothetical protein
MKRGERGEGFFFNIRRDSTINIQVLCNYLCRHPWRLFFGENIGFNISLMVNKEDEKKLKSHVVGKFLVGDFFFVSVFVE